MFRELSTNEEITVDESTPKAHLDAREVPVSLQRYPFREVGKVSAVIKEEGIGGGNLRKLGCDGNRLRARAGWHAKTIT